MKIVVSTTFPPSSIEWKGKLYKPGESLDLPDKDARRLIDIGQAAPAEAPKAPGPDGANADFEALTKAQICEQFGLDIDPARATKEEVIAAAKAKSAKADGDQA